MRGPAERDRLIWGWLRLALGVAQIVLSVAALALLSAVGLQSITWVFILSVAIAMVVSRLLYHGRPGPGLKGENGAMTESKKRVLILCTHNSSRSQMAEGLLRKMAGDRVDIFSAGTVATRVHPLAIKAMREIGIDISGHRSKTSDEFSGQPFDYVLTVCDSAKESCPIFPGKAEWVHWSFDDPSAAEGDEASRLAVFRRVRDEIRARLEEFVR